MKLPQMKLRNCPKFVMVSKLEGSVAIQEGHVFLESTGVYLGEAPENFQTLTPNQIREYARSHRVKEDMPPQEYAEEVEDEGQDKTEVEEVPQELEFQKLSVESIRKSKRGRPKKKIDLEVVNVSSVEPGR